MASSYPYSSRTYDAALLLRASTTAITGTETGSLILDVGLGLLDADLIIDVATMDVASTDEAYVFVLEGSPDAAFGTAGNITVLLIAGLGSAAGVATATGAPLGTSDGTGRFLFPFRNERNGTLYRYLRLKTVIAGSTPSLTFTAWIAKDE
jgi:hypothetical protein